MGRSRRAFGDCHQHPTRNYRLIKAVLNVQPAGDLMDDDKIRRLTSLKQPVRTASMVDRFFAILPVLLLAFVVGSVSQIWLSSRQTRQADPDLNSRIADLTLSLVKAARAISEIEEDIKKRQALVEQLRQDADTASKLAMVSKEQAEAVAQALRTEIASEQRQSFWSNQAYALFYTLLGVVLAELYHFLVNRLRRRRELQASGTGSTRAD